VTYDGGTVPAGPRARRIDAARLWWGGLATVVQPFVAAGVSAVTVAQWLILLAIGSLVPGAAASAARAGSRR
jgi:hypothetical protein